jgi:hypothetical protein
MKEMFSTKILTEAKKLLKDSVDDTPSVRLERFAAIIPQTEPMWRLAKHFLAQQLLKIVRGKFPRLDRRPSSAKAYRKASPLDSVEAAKREAGGFNRDTIRVMTAFYFSVQQKFDQMKNVLPTATIADVMTDEDMAEIINAAKGLLEYQEAGPKPAKKAA